MIGTKNIQMLFVALLILVVHQGAFAFPQQKQTELIDYEQEIHHAYSLMNTNRITEAITQINTLQRKAIETDNLIGQFQSSLALGHVHRRFMDIEEAEKCYRNAIKTATILNNHSYRSRAMGYLVCTLLMKDDYMGALDVCESSSYIDDIQTGDPLLIMTAATCYYELGRIPAAEAKYLIIKESSILDSLKTTESYHLMETQHLYNQGRYEEALRYLDGVCRDDFSQKNSYFRSTELDMLGSMFYQSGNVNKAIEILNFQIDNLLSFINSSEVDRIIRSDANANMLRLQNETNKIKNKQTQLAKSNKEIEADQLILLRERELSHNRMLMQQMRTDSINQHIQNLKMERQAHITGMNRLSIIQSNKQRERQMRYWLIGAGVLFAIFVCAIALVVTKQRNLKKIKRQNKKLEDERALVIKLKENVEVATREKELFIQQMSHEIRTPLNAINGFTQILAEPEMISMLPEEERTELFSSLHKNADDMKRIIDDIMLLTAIDSDTCPETATPEWLTERAVECLEHNARKFAGEGKYSINRNEADGNLIITVEDIGPGIPEGQEEKIFERFYKVDSFVQGAGLGLALCRAIARRLGGDVNVDKTYKDGARFIFRRTLIILFGIFLSLLLGINTAAAQDYSRYYEINEFINNGETIRAMNRANRLGREARQEKDNFKLFQSEMCLGNVMAARLKPAAAEEHYLEAIKIIDKTDMDLEKGLAYARLARVQRTAHKFEDAEKTVEKALKYTKKKDKLYVWILLNKCIAEFNTGNMIEFMKDYNTLSKLYPTSGVKADDDEYLQCRIYYYAAINQYDKAKALAEESPNRNYFNYQLSQRQGKKTDEYNYLKSYYTDLITLHKQLVNNDLVQISHIRGINKMLDEQMQAQQEEERLKAENDQLRWERANTLLETERNIERQLTEEQKEKTLSNNNKRLELEARKAHTDMELQRVNLQRETILENRQKVISAFVVVALLAIGSILFSIQRRRQYNKLMVVNAKLKESMDEAEMHLHLAQKEQAIRDDFMGNLSGLMNEHADVILRNASLIVDPEKSSKLNGDEIAKISQEILDHTDRLSKVVKESLKEQA